jgi:hypothetical protein
MRERNAYDSIKSWFVPIILTAITPTFIISFMYVRVNFHGVKWGGWGSPGSTSRISHPSAYSGPAM